jgi:hypothetical protein
MSVKKRRRQRKPPVVRGLLVDSRDPIPSPLLPFSPSPVSVLPFSCFESADEYKRTGEEGTGKNGEINRRTETGRNQKERGERENTRSTTTSLIIPSPLLPFSCSFLPFLFLFSPSPVSDRPGSRPRIDLDVHGARCGYEADRVWQRDALQPRRVHRLRVKRRLRAIPIRSTCPQATSNARTSQCGSRCGGLRDSRMPLARRSRTTQQRGPILHASQLWPDS